MDIWNWFLCPNSINLWWMWLNGEKRNTKTLYSTVYHYLQKNQRWVAIATVYHVQSPLNRLSLLWQAGRGLLTLWLMLVGLHSGIICSQKWYQQCYLLQSNHFGRFGEFDQTNWPGMKPWCTKWHLVAQAAFISKQFIHKVHSGVLLHTNQCTSTTLSSSVLTTL